MPPFVAGFTPSFTSSDSCRGKPQSVSTKTHLSSLTIKKRKSPHTSASSGKIFSIKKIFLKLLEITQINEGMIRFTSCTSECSNCSKCSLAARRSPYPSRPSRVLMHLDGMRARGMHGARGCVHFGLRRSGCEEEGSGRQSLSCGVRGVIMLPARSTSFHGAAARQHCASTGAPLPRAKGRARLPR